MSETINLGANLPVIYDWQGTNIFTDLMKQSRGLSSFEDPAEIQATIRRDANGNPVEPFGWVVKAPLRPGDEGEYRLKFKGKAIATALPAIISVEQRTEGEWQVATLTIPAVALEVQRGYKEPILMLRFSDLQDEPVQDVSLIKKSLIADNGSAPTFHPIWLTHLRRFKVIRFMNWMSYWLPMPRMNWEDRPKTSSLTQAGDGRFSVETVRGVAPEYILELAQLLDCDVWLNIPPLATDDYVSGLAEMMKAGLSERKYVYLEYGNEIWATGVHNEANWQGNANLQLAREEIERGDSALNFDGSTDWPLIAIRRYARRTKEIGDIFGRVFGETGPNGRIRPVYCYQSVNPDYSLLPGLEFLEGQLGGVSRAIWGIAPKTGVDEGVINKAKNEIREEDIIQNMRESLAKIIGGRLDEGNPVPVLEQAAALASWYGVAFAGYEGGIGLTRTAQLDPAVVFEMMKNNWDIVDICAQYLQAWFSYGNENLLCWFIAGSSDWNGLNFGKESDIHGLTWNINEQNTLPIQALDNALRRGSYEVTVGQSVPGRVDTRRHVARPQNWEQSLRNDKTWRSNNKFYLLNAPKAKVHSLQLVSEKNPGRESEVKIWLNNESLPVAKIIIPQGQGSHISSPYKIKLRKGLNALKMTYSEYAAGNYYFDIR